MKKINILLFIILAIIFRFYLSGLDFGYDMYNHMIWGKDLVNLGAMGFLDRISTEVYANPIPNYPPLSILMFGAITFITPFLYEAVMWINVHVPFFPSQSMSFFESKYFLIFLLKLPAMIADILCAILTYFIAKREYPKSKKMVNLLFITILFSPSLILVSALWGQIDSIVLFLGLASFYSLQYSKNLYFGALFFVLGILMKPNLIFLIPAFSLISYTKYSTKKIILASLFGLGIFCLVYLPFIGKFDIFLSIHTFIDKSLQARDLKRLSNSALNFWSFFYPMNFATKASDIFFSLITFEYFGILLWLSTFWIVSKKFIRKNLAGIHSAYLVLISAWSGFLFLTKMHERYYLYILIGLWIMAVKNIKWWYFYLVVNIFIFFNIYISWRTPIIPLIEFAKMFDTKFGIVLLSFINIFIFLFVVFFSCNTSKVRKSFLINIIKSIKNKLKIKINANIFLGKFFEINNGRATKK